MHERLLMSLKEKEEFFHIELVKHGVEYHKAAEVARIIVSGKPDELLTDKERQLATEVCRQWVKQRQRLALIYGE
ncbi:hypothetical protein NIES4073_45390 [Kalymmatonema gypsitolerans NIES-4073]|nr:hypothetical protein NIES4073_45390 [Scytonema sp. NIES-4073]